MSRRKQAKPQHINSEEDQGEQPPQQPAPEFADAAAAAPAAGEPGAPMNHPGTGSEANRDGMTAKRTRREETHICEKCCAEFFSFSEFLEHKKNCTKTPPVLIMNDSEGPVPPEEFPGAALGHPPHSPGGRSSLPSTFIRTQPTYVKVEVPGAFVGPATMSPGMTPLLTAQPRRQAKQHGCTRCGKNFSSASALQIHERTHTGEKPFVCNICGRAFTTKGNLKVHYMTHGANNSSARRGRKLAIENTMALLGTDGKRVPEMFPKEILAPSVNMDPVVWNQYTTMLNGGLAMKTNEISVIQSGGIPTLPVSLGASSIVNNTTISKMDGSQSAISAEVEKPGAADSVPKHQFPHFLEENKIAVS